MVFNRMFSEKSGVGSREGLQLFTPSWTVHNSNADVSKASSKWLDVKTGSAQLSLALRNQHVVSLGDVPDKRCWQRACRHVWSGPDQRYVVQKHCTKLSACRGIGSQLHLWPNATTATMKLDRLEHSSSRWYKATQVFISSSLREAQRWVG